ncbi:MAG: ComEC/Rec2 family competence protein [Desulfobacterales bacterium]|nr:ComEC/Rec2 family competence protein [Desulfobacterales bacterium]
MGRGERPASNTLALAAFVILVCLPGRPVRHLLPAFLRGRGGDPAAHAGHHGAADGMEEQGGRTAPRSTGQENHRRPDSCLLPSLLPATLGTLPFIVYYFNRISNITLVANLLLVPILGFVVLPLSMVLILVAPLSDTLSALSSSTSPRWLTRLCLDLNDRLASIPGSLRPFITTPEPSRSWRRLLRDPGHSGPAAGPARSHARRRTSPFSRPGRNAAAVMALAVLFLAGRCSSGFTEELRNRDTLRADVPRCGPRELRPRRSFPAGNGCLSTGAVSTTTASMWAATSSPLSSGTSALERSTRSS